MRNAFGLHISTRTQADYANNNNYTQWKLETGVSEGFECIGHPHTVCFGIFCCSAHRSRGPHIHLNFTLLLRSRAHSFLYSPACDIVCDDIVKFHCRGARNYYCHAACGMQPMVGLVSAEIPSAAIIYLPQVQSWSGNSSFDISRSNPLLYVPYHIYHIVYAELGNVRRAQTQTKQLLQPYRFRYDALSDDWAGSWCF